MKRVRNLEVQIKGHRETTDGIRNLFISVIDKLLRLVQIYIGG